ncbi:MAG: hypothetical protein ABJA71_09735 [Ginsengibacter sp.]
MKNKSRISIALLYIPIQVLVISAVSLLQLMDVSMADLYYYLAVVLVIAIGTVHVIVINKFLYTTLPNQIRAGLSLSFFIMFFSIVVIAIIYYYAGLDFQFMTFVIPFIVPYLCWHTYGYFYKLNEESK